MATVTPELAGLEPTTLPEMVIVPPAILSAGGAPVVSDILPAPDPSTVLTLAPQPAAPLPPHALSPEIALAAPPSSQVVPLAPSLAPPPLNVIPVPVEGKDLPPFPVTMAFQSDAPKIDVLQIIQQGMTPPPAPTSKGFLESFPNPSVAVDFAPIAPPQSGDPDAIAYVIKEPPMIVTGAAAPAAPRAIVGVPGVSDETIVIPAETTLVARSEIGGLRRPGGAVDVVKPELAWDQVFPDPRDRLDFSTDVPEEVFAPVVHDDLGHPNLALSPVYATQRNEMSPDARVNDPLGALTPGSCSTVACEQPIRGITGGMSPAGARSAAQPLDALTSPGSQPAAGFQAAGVIPKGPILIIALLALGFWAVGRAYGGR